MITLNIWLFVSRDISSYYFGALHDQLSVMCPVVTEFESNRNNQKICLLAMLYVKTVFFLFSNMQLSKSFKISEIHVAKKPRCTKGSNCVSS